MWAALARFFAAIGRFLGPAFGGTAKIAAKAAPGIKTAAKYGIAAAGVGAVSKALTPRGTGSSSMPAPPGGSLPPGLGVGERLMSDKPLTDRQHKREIALQRQAMYLTATRDILVTALRSPSIAFVMGCAANEGLNKIGIFGDDTASLVRGVLITEVGVKSAAVLIDALVPG